MEKVSHSPMLYEYLRRYQQDPTSRIFAPLAEAYRKAGLIAEAVEIAREGLLVHPHFVGGRVALARALFDLKKYGEVISELASVIQDVPDNLVAQRLLGESCLMTGRLVEALAAFKMLLYYSPNDAETARLVLELEKQAYEKGALVLRKDPEPQPEDGNAWKQVAFVPASQALGSDPDLQKGDWMHRIERAQGLLVRVERYRRGTSGLAE